MKSFFRALTLTSIFCAAAGSAMATVKPAPGPEIGDGMVGTIIATVVLSAFVLYPRLKRSRAK